jgi:hypothetical protein
VRDATSCAKQVSSEGLMPLMAKMHDGMLTPHGGVVAELVRAPPEPSWHAAHLGPTCYCGTTHTATPLSVGPSPYVPTHRVIIIHSPAISCRLSEGVHRHRPLCARLAPHRISTLSVF